MKKEEVKKQRGRKKGVSVQPSSAKLKLALKTKNIIENITGEFLKIEKIEPDIKNI